MKQEEFNLIAQQLQTMANSFQMHVNSLISSMQKLLEPSEKPKVEKKN